MSKSTRCSLSCLNARQVKALIWRYVIILKNSYISTTGRMFLWPLVVISIICFSIFLAEKNNRSTKEMAYYVPTFSIMITLFQVHHSLSILISDRASGFRALMLIMGLKRGSYYAANFLCFSVCICVSTIIIAFIFSRNIFINSEASLLDILILFLLFGIHLSTFIFAIASLLSSTIISGLLVFAALIIDPLYHTTIVGMASKSSDTLRQIILFIASISPFESIHLFTDSYIVCSNCNFSQVVQTSSLTGKVSQSTDLIQASMIFWSLVSFLFAYWVDQVCPWTADLPHKNSLFCLNWFKKTPQDQSIPMDDSFYETSNRFERSNIGQPVGIRIANVTKKFKQLLAVDSLSFNIHKGETTLLLGHNGAGKTTLMNMIFGKLIPDSGSITVNQLNVPDNHNESIGVCMQNNVFDEQLTVRQHLELFADIKDNSMDQLERRRHVNTTIVDVSLTEHSNKLPGELSGGMKRKLSLAMAFVGKSSVLILDEPSSGLDPDSRIFIWDAIRRYRADRTVLLSTQHMEEADYLGDRIAIMKAGKIICCGSSSFLNRLVGFEYRMRIECNETYREQVLAFIRGYFEEATIENDFSGGIISNPTLNAAVEEFGLNMVVMLTSSKTQDFEESLINLLDELEHNMESHHIKSFGLKSCSVEDVMLLTAKPDNEKFAATSTSNVSVDLKNLSANTIDPKLLRSHKQGKSRDSEFYILKALLYKHLHTYRRNIWKIVFYRLILATAGIYWLINTLSNTGYTVGSINTLMIIHYIFFPSQEKVFKFKSIQLASDANFIVYWLAQFLVDLFSVIYLMICIDVLLMYNVDSLRLEAQPSFEVRIILSISVGLLAISALLLAYVISTSTRTAKSAISVYLMPFVSSVMLVFLTRLAPLLPILSNASTNTALNNINKFTETFFIALLPTDSMAYLMYGLHSKCYIRRKDFPCFETSGTSPVALGFAALIGQIFLFSLLLYLIETRLLNISNICQLSNCLCSMITRKRRDLNTRVEDADVKAEATKVMQVIERPDLNSTSLVAADLSKSYRRGVKVIDDLWFKVGKGECFGLLGVNGAGKSTTFSILAAECRPDRGRVWLSGHYLADNLNSYRRNLGFDPQNNPEELHLTSEEALFLMARLRKVEETAIPSLVRAILEVLDMRQHANKIARQLSGGTLRKLSLGMSIIGNPDLLLLDEPTAGVDPLARRGIWRLLRSLCSQNNTSIVIASHAMEECEAICDRISIMARGKLRCIGSFLHLRNKFSQSCSLRVNFSGEGDLSHVVGDQIPSHTRTISQLSELLNSIFGPHIELTDSNINSVTYNISDRSFKRSMLFKTLREFRIRSRGRPNMSYLINDSSLEDIFIELAQEQRSEKEHKVVPTN